MGFSVETFERQAFAGDDIQHSNVAKVNGVVVNLTGCILLAALVANPSLPDSQAVWTGRSDVSGNGFTITNAALGMYTLDVPGSATASQSLNASLYLYIRLVDASKRVTTLVSGLIAFLLSAPKTIPSPGIATGLALPTVTTIAPTATAFAPFNPSSISGLVVWLEADALVTLSGSSVTAWGDQSGSGNNAHPPSGNPPTFSASTINGLPGIIATGTASLDIAALSAAITSPYTVYVVGQSGDTSIARTAVDTPAAPRYVLGGEATDGKIINLLTGGTLRVSSDKVSRSAHIYCGSPNFDGVNDALYVDNVRTPDIQAARGPVASLTSLRVCANATLDVGPWGGPLNAVLIYEGAHDVNARRKVMVAFSLKYGIPVADFAPADLPNLALYLDARDGVTLNGANASVWADQSTNAYLVAQTTSGHQPGFASAGGPASGSLPALTFDGATQFMSLATATVGASSTTFAIIKSATPAVPGTIVDVGSGATGYALGVSSDGTSNAREIVINGTAYEIDTTGLATLAWELWTVTQSPTGTTLRINGVAQTLSPSTASMTAPSASLVIGAADTNGTTPWSGSAFLFAQYSRVLSMNEIVEFETWGNNIASIY